jgi:hypothetical protein
VVDCEPLIVLMPSDHRLASREAIHPREFVGEIFIGGSEKATVLGAVTQDYLRRSGLNIQLDYNQRRVHAGLGGRTPVERCGTTACQTANLQHFAWRSDCSGLFHTPIAA